MSTITIYHNPRCSNSRSALALIRSQGIDAFPSQITYYFRTKEALFTELGLDAPGVTDAQLVDAMLLHPILINRPIVVTPRGARLCRPAEQVLEVLPAQD